MRALHHSFIALVVAASLGCDETAELEVILGAGQVEVDTRCDNGGCEEASTLAVQANITTDDRPATSVDLEQYRVDYNLSGTDESVPFFASPMNLRVSAGAPVTFTVHPAGDRQREWILSRFGYDVVDGTGTLVLAGYDQDDNLVTAEAVFDIAFGDFVTDGGGEEEADGGTP